jgi:hypothetical protein
MSLHNTVANKNTPCYRCTKSTTEFSKWPGSVTILFKFNIGWEYSIEYVEKRMDKSLIPNFFDKILTK